MITWTEGFDAAALAALITDATVLGTDLKAILFVNNVAPSKVLVLADLTHPTYTGYVAQSVLLGTPARDPVRGIVSVAPGLTWQETTTPVSVIIYGIAYTRGTGPLLAGVELFPNPIPLTDLLSFFVTVLEYVQTNDGASFSTLIQ